MTPLNGEYIRPMTTIMGHLTVFSLDLGNNKALSPGPSQQFSWAGHGGHAAPLNIPNIFRAAGLDTRWTPGRDPVFQVGLLYPQATGQAAPVAPAPAPAPAPVYSPAASVKVKKSIPNTEYSRDLPAVAPPYTGPTRVTTESPPPPSSTTTTTPTPTTTSTTTPSPTTPPNIYRYSTLVPPYRQSPTPASYHYNSGVGYHDDMRNWKY